ncbi:thiol disulfide oxidoreductase [Vespertiliibacter pulmonis]|uniref:Thiol:disulfide interchange protein DsbA n=1 Tax=Vespertiliibacter pulmonis TaxID=1443036 RepID=A0A3N4VIK7_9PAST|nr:thiol:disulfide interchange protein DsbA/DsbL [Vespertiliibacter pulmonis]QLB20761.1 thiol disulfide oxidoreductase [Vespertiliibacter pulmonis]RPE82648.1 thiol:disulfide interchange protein DsbA [Vespertiliibacter pulmonis]
MKLSFLSAFIFGLVFAVSSVQAEDKRVDPQKTLQNEPLFKDGKGYYSYKQALNIPLPKGKVLIQYFYKYGCPICLNADDYLKQYAERHKDTVVLQRSPAFDKGELFTAQMNAAFNVYGKPELADKYLFDSANRNKGKRLVENDDEIKRWLTQNSIDISQFHQVFMSGKVKQQIEKDKALYFTYSPPVVPIAVLNGKYILIQNTLYDDDYTNTVLDFLVNKLQQEQESK